MLFWIYLNWFTIPFPFSFQLPRWEKFSENIVYGLMNKLYILLVQRKMYFSVFHWVEKDVLLPGISQRVETIFQWSGFNQRVGCMQRTEFQREAGLWFPRHAWNSFMNSPKAIFKMHWMMITRYAFKKIRNTLKC